MRYTYFFSVLLFSFSSFAHDKSSTGWEYRAGYVVSETFDPSIPPGKFVMHGIIQHCDTNRTVHHASIRNSDRSIKVRSDLSGCFEVMFDVTDTAIYCYKRSLGGLPIWGPFKSQHRVEVRFELRNDNRWHLPFQRETSVVTKPVIYGYNAPGEVQLSIKPRGEFSFTYPETLTGSWTFSTNPDGSITDLNSSKDYPYLFWEGPGKNLDFIADGKTLEGFFIKTDTCAQFFESVLQAYGLNKKEGADFITWWAPQLVQKEFALIQFFTNDDYKNIIAEISIAPEPLSVLRLYMYVALSDEPIDDLQITQPSIPVFKRQGFTVIEWGGSVLNLSQPGF